MGSNPILPIRRWARRKNGTARLGGVMVASTVWDGRASVRFRAEPLGDIAQLVERCLSKAKASGSTPLIPTVVGPDIKWHRTLLASLAQW